ncbi:MAG: (d)CMP kinase [Lewinellaceae bacterium]|nr:(d)CMP kinase [Lewinella sp.]MCB9279005.1 (d)CMP kinase [Lewinellaceae bacterium]
MKKIIVAIDGYSSCGKSTLAKALAGRLGYAYVDSGAMYRAATLYLLRHGIGIGEEDAVEAALDDIHIRFERNPSGNRTLLNGEDVEEQIRSMEVSAVVSEVSAISPVRRAMVRQQQNMGKHKGIVMDGRDIGTVVFPDAELKIFLTAAKEIRVARRYRELKAKGIDISLGEVEENLAHRDLIDSTRDDSPLRQAEDAVVLDNSHLTPEQQLDQALQLVHDIAGATT